MTEPTQPDQDPNEPKPIKVNATTTALIGAAMFVAGGLVCATTYGRVLKSDCNLNIERCKAAWGIIDIHKDFLKEKNLTDEFDLAKGHLQLLN